MSELMQSDESAILDAFCSEEQGFVIDDDALAEWAMRKIQAENDEADRLVRVCKKMIEQYEQKAADYIQKTKQRTSHLVYELERYFDSVPHKATKTQETYAMPCGKMVRKFPQPTYDHDDAEILEWLHGDNVLSGFIKVEEKPIWGELKKHLTRHGDNAIYSETGELVPGVKVVLREPEFKLEVTG